MMHWTASLVKWEKMMSNLANIAHFYASWSSKVWRKKFSSARADGAYLGNWAEEVGFEPTKACTLHDFQSCSLDHYETPPRAETVGFQPTQPCTLPLFHTRSFYHP